MADDPQIGCSIRELDTPALLLDLDACDANLGRMAAFFADRSAQLRPHFKNHKCTTLARRQLAAGAAVGMTCASLFEAQALAAAGCEDILIANQVVGDGKLRRLAELAGHCRMTVAVDDFDQASRLAEVMAERHVTVGVLLEVDIGMGRCGVPPGPPAVELAHRLAELPGIEFRGLQAYEGHSVYLNHPEERKHHAEAAMQLAIDTRCLIERDGIPAPTISGCSSATCTITGAMPGVTEVQAGTYATMDWRYREMIPEFELAQSVLATVLSCRPSKAILDAGVKSVGAEFGPPKIKDAPGATIPMFASEEHCIVHNPPDWKVGDTVEVVSSHACTTSNLHPCYFVHRQGRVEQVWAIDGRRSL